jgi:predicted metal-dependent phosphoesterase TrpH
MRMHYDLHSHSLASDGTLSPAQLVNEARTAGVQVLALTDHDTTDGLAAAQAAIRLPEMHLVAGVEISVSWQSQTVHILGLGIDPDCTVLQAGLAGLREYRDWRAAEIGRRLAREGIADSYRGARALARGRIVSRTHFARFLLAGGYGTSIQQVFKRYLAPGKSGYVTGRWADLETALNWIGTAGGMAVIAHPARYRMTAGKLRRLVGEFRECGGLGMEVVSGSHTRENTDAMAALCRNEKLLASCGSDYHGPENPWIRLGELAQLPPGCRPVWESEHWPARLVQQ